MALKTSLQNSTRGSKRTISKKYMLAMAVAAGVGSLASSTARAGIFYWGRISTWDNSNWMNASGKSSNAILSNNSNAVLEDAGGMPLDFNTVITNKPVVFSTDGYKFSGDEILNLTASGSNYNTDAGFHTLDHNPDQSIFGSSDLPKNSAGAPARNAIVSNAFVGGDFNKTGMAFVNFATPTFVVNNTNALAPSIFPFASKSSNVTADNIAQGGHATLTQSASNTYTGQTTIPNGLPGMSNTGNINAVAAGNIVNAGVLPTYINITPVPASAPLSISASVADPYSAATAIAADTDVKTFGSLMYAFNFNNANTNNTVNGVTFTGSNSFGNVGSGSITLTGFTNNNGSNTFGTASGLSTNYQTILGGGTWASSATPATLTLNSLTSGHQYAMQFWVEDSRGGFSARGETLSSGGETSSTLSFAVNNSGGAAGQYTVGLFTAGSVSQSYTITPNSQNILQINAIQLRDITNIGYWDGGSNTSGVWDASTTANFATNLYSAALTSDTFANAKVLLTPNAVTFADSYWNSSVQTTVTQNAITIASGGVSITGGYVMFQNKNINYTVTSSDANGISGTTTVELLNGGTVTLVGTHAYSGATFISTGSTLNLGNGTTDGILTSSAVTDNGSLIFNTVGSPTFGQIISGSGIITKIGIGTQTLSVANTYTGGTTLTAGQLNISNANALGTGTLTLNGGTLNPSSSLTVANPILVSNSGTILTAGGAQPTFTGALTGTGTLTATSSSGNQTFYAGTMSGFSGTFQEIVGGGGNWWDGSNAGGTALTLNLSPASSTVYLAIQDTAITSKTFNIGALIGNSGATIYSQDNGSAKAITLSVGALNTSTTYAGIIKDSWNGGGNTHVSLIKIGTGTLTLSGANPYTGGTTISAGSVLLSGTGAINSSSGITINGSGASFVQLSSTASTPAVTLTQGTIDGTGTVGNVTVADLAANTVAAGNGGFGTLTIGNLTFNGAATVSLPGAAAPSILNVSTLLISGVSKTITVNAGVAATVWAPGATKLVGYTTYNGTNFSDFTIGTLTGLTANQKVLGLINNTGSSQIQVQIAGQQAGVITWGAAKTIAADTDVFNVGTAAYAYNWNTNSLTVNGTTFTGSSSFTAATGNAGGSVTLTGFTSNNANAFTVSGLSAPYGGILAGASYATTTSPITVTLNNLTSNHVYATEFWVNDGRGGSLGSHTETITSTGGNTRTLTFGSSTAGVLGQYTLGGFTAGGTTQAFTLTGSAVGQINAIQLRDVTGVWSGGTNGAWDTSSTSANLNWTGSNNYNTVTGLTNTLYFADTDGFGNAVTNNAVTVTLGGVSNNGGTINFINNAVNYTFSSLDATGITGTTALVQSGTGTVTLNGANTFTGGVTINAGNLVLGNTGALNSTAGSENAVAFGAGSTGILSLNGNSVVIANLTTNATVGTPVVQDSNATNVTLTVGNSTNASGTFAGVLQNGATGTLSLTKAGTGTLTLTGANTYTGGTTISAGTLQIGNGGTTGSISATAPIVDNGALIYNVGANSTPNLTSGGITGTGSLTVTGIAIQFNGGTISLGGNQTYTASGTSTNQGIRNGSNVTNLIATGGASITMSGGLGATFNSGVVGTLTLDTSSGNGAINLNVSDGSSGVLYPLTLFSANAGTGTITVSGANVLNGWGSAGTTEALTGVINITSNLANAGTLSLNTTGNSTFTSVLSGGGNLIKLGAATLTISGTNTYTGGTSINAGVVNVGNASAFGGTAVGNGVITINASGTVITGSAFNLQAVNRPDIGNTDLIVNGNASFANNMTIANAGGADNVNGLGIGGTGTLTYTGQINGGGNLQGMFSLNNSVTLILGSGGSISVVNSGQGDNGLLWINGAATMNVNGGTLTTTGNNGASGEFIGGTMLMNAGTASISGGVINLTQNGTGGGGTAGQAGTVSLNGGTLSATGFSGVSGSTVNFNGGTLQALASNASFLPSPITAKVQAGGAIINTGAFSPTIGDVLAHDAALGATVDGGLTKLGVGTLTLSNANTYTGGTTLTAGQLNINNNNALGTNYLLVNGALTIDNTSGGAVTVSNILNVSGTTNVTFGGTNPLTFTNGINLVTSGATVTITVNGSSPLTIDGILNNSAATNNAGTSNGVGGVAFTKAGAGTLTINGASVFGGGKTINLSAGTLNLNNNGALQSFGGNGANTFNIAANTTVDNTSGGLVTIANGNSGLGTMNWNGDFTFGGTNALSINAAVGMSASRQVTVNGSALVTLTGGITGNTFNFTKAGPGSLTESGAIATTGGGVSVSGGTLTLSGANTFTGGTSINAGVINVGNASAFGGTAVGNGVITINASGTVITGSAFNLQAVNRPDIGNTDLIVNGNASFANNMTIANAGGADNVNGLGIGGTGTLTYTGQINGGGNLQGMFSLNNSVTLILGSGGSISVVNSGQGDNGLLWINGAATMNVNGGTLTTTGNNGASGEFIGGTMLMNAGTASISGGVINLTQNGTGGGGTAGQAGTVSLNGGTLSATGFSGVSGSTVNFNGGTLQALASNASFLPSPITAKVQAGGAIINTGAFSPTIGDVLAHDAALGATVDGGLTKLGVGTLTLSNANTYTGGTTVSAGKLIISGSISNVSPVVVGSGAFLSLTGTNATGSGGTAGTYTINGGTISNDGAANTTEVINGNITLNAGTLTATSAFNTTYGNFVLFTNNGPQVIVTGSAESTISAVMALAGNHTFNVADVTPGVDLMVTGRLIGNNNNLSGAIIKTGAGTLDLANSLNGTNPSGGLALTGVQLNAGQVIFVNGGLGNGISFGGGALPYIADFTGNSTLTWDVGNTQDISASSLMRIEAGVTATLDTGANNVTLGTTIVVGGAGAAVTKAGSGTLTITASNTYTGPTTVTGGELDLNSSAGLAASSSSFVIGDGVGGTGSDVLKMLTANQISTAAAVQIDGLSGKLDLGNINLTIGSLADRTGGTGSAGILALGAVTLTVGDSTSTTYSGSITGTTDGLIKNGTGTLSLAGANLAINATTVNAGKLNFSATSGTVTLSSLSGVGTTNFAAGANVGGTFSQGTATVAGVGTFNIVSGGTVNLNGTTSSITTLNGGTVNLGSTALTVTSGTDAGSITGASGSLIKNGLSTLTLTAANAYGATTINAGTLQIGNNGTTGTLGTGPVTDNSLLVFNRTDSFTVNNLIGDSFNPITFTGVNGNVTQAGTGTLILNVSNTYTGVTTITNGGVLATNNLANYLSPSGIGEGNAAAAPPPSAPNSFGIGNASSLVFDGGTLRYANSTGPATTNRLFSITANGGTIDASGTHAADTLTFAVPDTSNNNIVFQNSIIWAGTPSTLTLTGVNTGNNTFGDSLNDDGSFDALSLTKNGPGAWVLGGPLSAGFSADYFWWNAYNGVTTIAGGTLRMGANEMLPDATMKAFGSGNVVLTSGGTLDLAGFSTHINGLSDGGGAGGTVDNQTANSFSTLTLGGNDASATFRGNIMNSGSNAVLAITKFGAGVQTLSGSNTYSGITSIQNGTLQLGSAHALPTNAAVSMANAATGGTLDLAGQSPTLGSLNVAQGAGGTYTGDGIGTGFGFGVNAIAFTGGIPAGLAMGQSVTGSNVAGGTLIAGFDGNLVILNTNLNNNVNGDSFTFGAYDGNANNPIIGNSGSTPSTLTVDTTGGNSSFGDSLGGIIQDTLGAGASTVALSVTGTHTLTLGSSNTYSGATLVTGNATLQVTSDHALGNTTNGTTVTSGATLLLNNVNYTTPEALSINGAGANNAGALSNSGSSTYAGLITVASNAAIGSGGGTLTLTGGIVKNGTTLTLTGGGVFNINSVISGSLAHSDLNVSGTTANLNMANTYNGPTTVTNGGNIVLGVNNAIPNNSAVTLGDGSTTGTLTMGSFTNIIGSLALGTSPGGGTVAMQANQTSSAQLAASTANGGSGLVTLGTASTLNLTGMSTGAGLYRLISGTSGLGGTFGTVTGLDSAYSILYTPNEVDAQHKGTIGTVTATPAKARILTTTASTTFNFTVQNSAPSGGANLNFTATAGTNVSGGPLGPITVAPTATSGSTSGFTFNNPFLGAGNQTGTFTITDSNASNSPQTGTVTVDVVNQRTFSAPAINLGRFLITGTPSGTTAVSSTGLNNVTANATLGSFSGISTDGLTLSTSDSTVFNGAVNTQTANYTIGGTAATAGAISGTFSSAVTAELGAIPDVTVSLTGNALNLRTFTAPATLDLGNLLENANVAVSGTLTISSTGNNADTTSAQLDAAPGGTSNGLSLNGSAYGFTGGSFNDSTSRTITGTLDTSSFGTRNGTFNNTVTTLETGLGDTYAPVAISYTANVGIATAALSDRGGINSADRLAYQMTSTEVGSQTLFNGTVLTAVVGNTDSYAGLASRTIAGGTVLGTEAIILAGTNQSGGTNTVAMTWRDRSTLERPDGSSPPLPTTVGSPRYLISDVVLLTGMNSGEGQTVDTNNTIPGNPYTITNYQTDIFALQMSYSDGANPTLDWLDPSDSTWKLANAGDFGGNDASGGELDFIGSFSTFQTTYGSTLSAYLGAYGYDPTTSVAWAVIDHNSQFAVMGEVPEPTSLGLLGLGALGLLSRRRRNKKV